MSFDEENNENTGSDYGTNEPKTFFGVKMSNGVVYAAIAILALIFIRQVVVLFQALN